MLLHKKILVPKFLYMYSL